MISQGFLGNLVSICSTPQVMCEPSAEHCSRPSARALLPELGAGELLPVRAEYDGADLDRRTLVHVAAEHLRKPANSTDPRLSGSAPRMVSERL